jgi:hypothetical protein
MGETISTCKNMIGKPEGNQGAEKMTTAETGWVVGNWIYLHQVGEQSWISLKR